MFNWVGLVQVLIIAIMMWMFYRSFIQNTQSEKLVRGLLGLAGLWVLSFVLSWMRLDLLASFLHYTALFLSLSLIVVFQPELRKFMALLGNIEGWRRVLKRGGLKTKDTKSLDAIVSAVEYMSAKHTGALIVFPSTLDESAIDKKGVAIDAKISSELLLTIFFNKTPLHDGAVIIENQRIAYAGGILPLSQNNLNWKYGTRHRAALGLSEVSRAVVLVVSEESGDISIAEKGKFTKYDDMKKLRAKLEKVLLK
ncbi:MAG: diadenylate cyclase CdaA [Alphaproteobacteria bacterium]|nr:diadenylate cyclase CdaA [Alphaproteobacteria bacterium]MBQ8042109.1 diadenylate cyclase CdaA [Alphaproteobacteria bacterium]MBQ8367663.1 diadenylate cyclase CdaA [Alphaproteobacteria bacterium]MBQ8728947.1 diadenylate cyclase CdaA [Alphaproteobacteria bacterium]